MCAHYSNMFCLFKNTFLENEISLLIKVLNSRRKEFTFQSNMWLGEINHVISRDKKT